MAKYTTDTHVITYQAGTVSGNVSACELSIEADEQETTGYGESWRSRIAGLKNATITMTWYQGFTGGTADVDALLWGQFGSTALITIKAGTAAVSTANPLYSVTALVTQVQPFSGQVGDIATQSVTWPITGTVTRGTTP
jgi:hypothetical protein